MAPRGAAAQRRNQSSQNEHVYNPGVIGRKTGISIPDTGLRDADGFELADNLFSSPEKAQPNGSVEEEEDMDIDETSGLDPAAMRAAVDRARNQGRLSIPRSRSPHKTNLQSPARRNVNLGPASSPSRSVVEDRDSPDEVQPTKRRLDFSKNPRTQMKPAVNGNYKTNGRAHEEDSDDSSIIQPRGPTPEDGEDSMQMVDMGGDDDVENVSEDHEGVEEDEEEVEEAEEMEEEEEAEEEPEEAEEEAEEEEVAPVQPKPTPRSRGRPKKNAVVEPIAEAEESISEEPPAVADEEEEPAKGPKKRGRPKKSAVEDEPKSLAKSPKRRRSGNSSGIADSIAEEVEAEAEVEAEVERVPKRQKTQKATKPNKESKKPAPVAPKGKAGRPRKSSGVGVDSPVVQKGPPMPKSRGLVSLRRDDSGAATTRSGRQSFRPLEYWKGERFEYDQDDIVEDAKAKGHILLPKVKGVVRAEEVEDLKPTKRRPRGRPAAKTKGRKSSHDDEEVEREDWETETGRVAGEVLVWYAEHEMEPPKDEEQVEIIEDDLAIAAPAIETRDIKDASFRFAKTLSLPFFGSGVVDLPPGSEKKPKNSRKMQMVFFVYTGMVQVTINNTTFRIGKGGMWFVPRGNYYSIENDTDRPARVFFAQGCEVLVESESQESML